MQMGMIGLGRMGAIMVKLLLKGDHQCVIYDITCLLSGEKGAYEDC
jgi:6-phosphogluconate dehydrogenase (decarboxylating)